APSLAKRGTRSRFRSAGGSGPWSSAAVAFEIADDAMKHLPQRGRASKVSKSTPIRRLQAIWSAPRALKSPNFAKRANKQAILTPWKPCPNGVASRSPGLAAQRTTLGMESKQEFYPEGAPKGLHHE